MENYKSEEIVDMILDGSYYKVKKGETLVDEMCGKLHKEAEENEIDEEPAPVKTSMDQLEDEITEAEDNEIKGDPVLPVDKTIDKLEDEVTEADDCPDGYQRCPVTKKCIPIPKGQGVRTGKGVKPTGTPTPRKGRGLNPVRQGRGQRRESVVNRIKETYHNLTEQEKTKYQKFFMSMMKKFNVTEPDQLTVDKKKEFFDAVDKGWKAKKESD